MAADVSASQGRRDGRSAIEEGCKSEPLPPAVQQLVPIQNSLDGNTVSIPLDGVFAGPDTGDAMTMVAGLPQTTSTELEP